MADRRYDHPSWPYAYFVVTPVNILLYDARREAPPSAVRKLVREWGLLEWGQTAIGVAAAAMFACPSPSRRERAGVWPLAAEP